MKAVEWVVQRKYTVFGSLIIGFTGVFCVLWFAFNNSSSDAKASPTPEVLSPSPTTPEAPSTSVPITASPSPFSTELIQLVYVSESGKDPNMYPLGVCQGHCDVDIECDFGLVCFERKETEDVPGCFGEEEAGRNFCTRPWEPNILVLRGMGGIPPTAFPLRVCEGRCEYNEDCEENLECFHRSGDQAVPGCLGKGVDNMSYCVAPQTTTTEETPSPTIALSAPPTEANQTPSPTTHMPSQPPRASNTLPPTVSPTKNEMETTPGPTKPAVKPLTNRPLRIKSRCTPQSRCRRCEGDCKDNDKNCKKGLVCVPRTSREAVHGCESGGKSDIEGVDFCAKPLPEGRVTYVPGDRTLKEHGLLLSTGLTARIVARQYEKVKYVGGTESEDDFHEDPDGAAVFADSKTGGWIYVSNSESSKHGGVGAITFNSDGEVVDYKMIVTGTRRNCGGGKTFWNTWLTCEEDEGGQVWEADPWGKWEARQTLLGGDGDLYESAAYDNRNVRDPTFYVTTDEKDGAVVKYTPDFEAVNVALSTDPPNYKNLLHTNQTGTARLQYLVLEPDPANEDMGSFSWSDTLEEGRKSAYEYHQNCEGIDIRKGILYFTCKKNKSLFILDLDRRTFERSSTQSGAFDNGPDQVARLLGDNESAILYFCEDGGKKGTCGVHGRDSNGKFYTILESHVEEYIGETSGLAFSPDNMHMYVSFQKPGIIFDVTRTDNFPFGGQRLDIKYHEDEENSSQ